MTSSEKRIRTNSCRVSANDGVRRHVAADHGAGGDHGAVADGDAGQDQRSHADPDVVPDADVALARGVSFDAGCFRPVGDHRERIGGHEIRTVIAAKQDHDLNRQRAILADDERRRLIPPPNGGKAIGEIAGLIAERRKTSRVRVGETWEWGGGANNTLMQPLLSPPELAPG